MTYFSDREYGEAPRNVSDLSANVWRGIKALIEIRVEDGSFGSRFPSSCPDGGVVCGTNERNLRDTAFAEIPNLETDEYWLPDDPPSVVDVMDLIEFCWRSLGKPISIGYHSYWKHDHLKFDIDLGRIEFSEEINRLFRRNGLAYELNDKGVVERLAPAGLREVLTKTVFDTGDSTLDRMLESARTKYLNPDEDVRREALEKLWDAWERAKTLEPGTNKKNQVSTLLDRVAKVRESKFREMIEEEAKILTKIGNSFQIRHSETNQERLIVSDHVDYLFHRLYSMIRLVLSTTDRGR